MTQQRSPFTQRRDPLTMVCASYRVARATVYAQSAPADIAPPPAPANRGPKTAVSDLVLIAAIRQALADGPFHGEGHRKMRVRLRGLGHRVGRNRVLRLMRAAGLLAPQRARIVPEGLWTAAQARLTGAREEYVRRAGGQTWGRPVNGRANSPYLLTGLGQCGVCGGGLFVRSWKSGEGRAFGYGCSSHYLRGPTVCENRQMLPMPLIDGEVLTAFRDDLLDPAVVTRAFQKLRDRLAGHRTTTPDRPRAIQQELAKVEAELSRLVTAVADGGNLSSLVAALRARETHREELRAQLAASRSAPTLAALDLDAILPELRRRMNDWRRVLAEEPTQAREMLRTLLEGRIVFTPNLEARSCVIEGRGNMDELFRGLIELPMALASPTGLSKVDARPRVGGPLRRVA